MKRYLTGTARDIFAVSIRDVIVTAGVLAVAVCLCLLLDGFGSTDVYVPLIFVLAVQIISMQTEGYLFGIIASVAGVFGVNYAFTYPYFNLNFTLSGYPLTFICMLIVSISTGMLTTRVKQQEKLRRESEREKLRADLLRAISHDLRTPLTSIVGSASAMLENGETLTDAQKKALMEGVLGDARWLIRIVENILSVTRVSGDTSGLKKSPEAIEEVFSEVVARFRKSYPDMPVNVSAPDELLLAPMDAMLIEQVIMNLLENAATHGRTTSEIKLFAWAEDGGASVMVEDDGVGLGDIDPDKLFERGQTVPGGLFSQTAGKKNLGIGLYVCSSIIKAHGGKIRAESREVGGTRFIFTLPME